MTSLKGMLAASAAAAGLAGTALAAPIGYTLAKDGTTLVVVPNLAAPGATMSIAITGAIGRVDAIDFRPATGELVGYDSVSDRFYTINTATGVATDISTPPLTPTTGRVLDIDWNPTIDRLRLVTSDDDNIVFNPVNGATTLATDLFYVAADANFGEDPNIIGNGYTQSFFGPPNPQTPTRMTTQYVIDSTTNDLGILANNLGSITTVAALTLDGVPFDFGPEGGFDIYFDAALGQDIAYAILEAGGVVGLFTLNLTNGALTRLGDFAAELARLSGFTVAIAPNEVPVPAALPLFAAGLAGLSFARRRKKEAAAR